MTAQNSNDHANNASELQPPQWLNEEFFSNLLKKKKQDKSLKVTKATITAGSGKSDNYSSIVFRAKLNYTIGNGEEKNISLIIKTAPIFENQKKELLEKVDMFETEIKMFAKTLPQIEAILRNHGDETKLGPNLFYYALHPYKCPIFEDLGETGYKVARGRYATIEEVKLAFLKLSKLHAVSYKLAKEDDISVISFKNGSFSDKKILDFPLAANAIKTIKEVLAEVEDLAYFVPLFEKIEDKILDKIFATFNAYQNGERDGIFVLNHGDFHFKNMMIKENGGRLEDLMLLDYQISVFSTAAIDVSYALIMFLSPDMRLNHRDELIYYYFTNFQKTLKLIEFQGRIPQMIDFQQEMLKHSHWELFLFIAFIVFNYVFLDKDGDIRKSVDDENYRREVLKRPAVINEFRATLPKFLYKGYFDF